MPRSKLIMLLECYGNFSFDETSLVMKMFLVVIMLADEMSPIPPSVYYDGSMDESILLLTLWMISFHSSIIKVSYPY